LIFSPQCKQSRSALIGACLLVIIGAFAQLYVIIIGGQAFPLDIFPGYLVESSFYDGVINTYTPSIWEMLLGLGGFTTSILIALLSFRVLPILPEILAAED
jgi:molybdopterin-containing oxidoreductase family membrane subunit